MPNIYGKERPSKLKKKQKKKKKPTPSMLGTGGASQAGTALKNRYKKIDRIGIFK